MIKKNILVIVKTLGQGGISKYVEQTYLSLNKKNEFKISLLILSKNNDEEAIKLLDESGIEIFTTPAINKNPIGYFKKINEFFKKNAFDIVHWHTDNWINVYPVMLARKLKIERILIQSHNSSNTDVSKSFLKSNIQRILRTLSKKWKIQKIAVSEEAASWMFRNSEDALILPNPVDVQKFRYSQSGRREIREKFDIKDTKLFGNVGRFDEQKNQKFLIEVFKEIHNIDKNARLMLIGTGKLKDALVEQVKELNIEQYVTFIDWTEDIDKYYSAFDEVIFPSLFEGFPLSLIEAQCSGCPIVYSDSITRRVEILDTTIKSSLNNTPKFWAELAMNNADIPKKYRENAYKLLMSKNFDYMHYTNILVKLY